jgi:RNA polymerase sigma-B factor
MSVTVKGRSAIDGDHGSRDQLFEQFAPMARRLAGRYHSAHEPLEDLVQVAYVGLLGAIDRFDPDRGVQFRSFAIPTIIGELKRHFRNTGWAAHVPRGAQELALCVDHAAHEIRDRTGRTPKPEELARYMDVDLEGVLIGLDAGTAHFSTSLDAPPAASGVDEPQPLGDMFGADENGYALVDAKLSLAATLPRLPHLERVALSLRMRHSLKQSEIAARMGCSQMQVSRLLRSAADHAREMSDPPLGGDPPPREQMPASRRQAGSPGGRLAHRAAERCRSRQPAAAAP